MCHGSITSLAAKVLLDHSNCNKQTQDFILRYQEFWLEIRQNFLYEPYPVTIFFSLTMLFMWYIISTCFCKESIMLLS